jgi:hypothetical protein
MRGMSSSSSRTKGFLISLRCSRDASRRRRVSGVGDRQRWRRTRVRLGVAQEGLGTRVSGVKARRTGVAGLNKPREALACGPMARSAVRGRDPKLGSGSGSV